MLEALSRSQRRQVCSPWRRGYGATINTGSIPGWLSHGTSEATTCPAHGVMGRPMRRTPAVRAVAVHSVD